MDKTEFTDVERIKAEMDKYIEETVMTLREEREWKKKRKELDKNES